MDVIKETPGRYKDNYSVVTYTCMHTQKGGGGKVHTFPRVHARVRKYSLVHEMMYIVNLCQLGVHSYYTWFYMYLALFGEWYRFCFTTSIFNTEIIMCTNHSIWLA